ncbi:helix-turn-helix domain-containing protein [Sphingomonas sp.]|uniref:AraC family transcriptional regulator n=1 Tax=Sphingomonas sp. TaxID=28214 RepID=UPI001B13779E|nr:helix-turn-helix domain-containing protein [Sphingomonas sp.]MBO9713409.1 AraC family transcriptional regulator [Sphingomonas sp.]
MPADGELLPLVESFYLFRHPGHEIDGVDRVDIGQVRFMLRGSGHRVFPDGHRETSLAVMVNGPCGAAAAYHIDGPFECFGVSLRALGWKSLIGIPANKVSNCILDAREVFGAEVTDLLEQLRALDSLEAMAAVVVPFLLARRTPVPRNHVALVLAVREWAASGEPGIEGLYARAGMSERQAARLCNEYFGGPPKHLERKFRAIRAAMVIYQGGDPKDAAAPFADQPHMIKEIKHFTGHTPTTLKEGIDPVLAVTLDNETFHFLPEVIPESVDAMR